MTAAHPATALSVVVPTFNNLPVLQRCLAGWRLHAADQPVEVIVVDDGCTDGTAEWLAAQQATPWGRERLRVLQEDDGHELRCTNRGFAAARGELLVAWQADMFLESRWLVPELRRTFAAYPEIGLLNLSYGLDLFPADGPGETWEELYDGRRLRSSIGPTPWNWVRLQEVDAMIRPWAVRRACVEDVGPLDVALARFEWDEPDFAFRIRQAGWAVAAHAYERDGAYVHLGSATLSRTSGTTWYREGVVRNARLFHDRWAPAIAAGHARARRTWRRQATLAGWAGTAAAAARQAVRRGAR